MSDGTPEDLLDEMAASKVAIGSGGRPIGLDVTETGEADDAITWLRHNRIDLALHLLRPASDPTVRPLLVLHGLGEESSRLSLEHVEWAGEVHGLDFTGHGRSTVPVGGGYTCEILVGDVDAAVDHLGSVTVLGRGLGGYIALLIAAARPDAVMGVVIADGPGIAGGGIQPGSPSVAFPAPWSQGPPDPFALIDLTRDMRPPDYAQNLLHLALENSALDVVVHVTAVARPEWVEGIVNQPGVRTAGLAEALGEFEGRDPR